MHTLVNTIEKLNYNSLIAHLRSIYDPYCISDVNITKVLNLTDQYFLLSEAFESCLDWKSTTPSVYRKKKTEQLPFNCRLAVNWLNSRLNFALSSYGMR